MFSFILDTYTFPEYQSESDVGAMLEIEARERAIRREAMVVENPEFRYSTTYFVKGQPKITT